MSVPRPKSASEDGASPRVRTVPKDVKAFPDAAPPPGLARRLRLRAEAGAARREPTRTTRPSFRHPKPRCTRTARRRRRTRWSAVAAHGLAWDEALSGAAGAIAVTGEEPTMPAVRWAAIRAGYPYPVLTAVSGRAGSRRARRRACSTTFRVSSAPGDDLGLARARVEASDVWVGARRSRTRAGSCRSPERSRSAMP